MILDIEKLKYLLNDTEAQIGILVDNVLRNSPEDPHYSAVAAVSRIHCYIAIMEQLGEEMPYKDVQGFFDFNAYTAEEYQLFLEAYEEEREGYMGPQY